MSGRIGGIPDLTATYLASTDGRLDLDATLGSFKLDGASLGTGTAGNDDGPDYLAITRGATNILNTSYNAVDLRTHIYSSAVNGVDVGPDPAIFPNRSTVRIGPDQLEFLRQDRQINVGSPGFFFWDSVLNLSAAIPLLSRSFGGFVTLAGTFEFDASASPSGMGNVLLHNATWKNANGIAANLGPSFLFANNAVYQADGATITASQAGVFFDNAQYNVINAGVGSMPPDVGHVSYYGNLTVDSGWTIGLRRGLFLQDATVNGTGVLTDQVVVDIVDMNAGATNTGIRSVMTAGAGKFFIEHAGSALSLFGGEVEIDGALNHDGALVGFRGSAPVALSAAYVPTNVTTDRVYDANATTIDELADVLGTLIADLQLQGLLG